jgi:hypothetical protein
MTTLEEKITIIENAIDAVIIVGEDIVESDAAYFINNENSVVSKLRSLQFSLLNESLK